MRIKPSSNRPTNQPTRKQRLTAGAGTDLVEELLLGPLPDLEDLRAQPLVGLVNVALGLDGERGAHEGEERRVEVDGAVRIERHVHRDEALQSESCLVSAGRGRSPDPFGGKTESMTSFGVRFLGRHSRRTSITVKTWSNLSLSGLG